jgi:ubiquinone/menaquinone biosynthesis C-methylase UbiE
MTAKKKAATKSPAKKRKSSAPAGFYREVAARGWQQTNYMTFSSSYLSLRRWIAAQLTAKKLRILSIGCGSGELELHLADQSHRVTGIDLSFAMLKRGAGKGFERTAQADALRLPFAAAQFDVVLIPETIGHLPLGEAIAEARRVLKKRGRILITSYGGAVEAHPKFKTYHRFDIADALTDTAFDLTAQHDLTVTPKAVREAPSEQDADIIFVMAIRQD